MVLWGVPFVVIGQYMILQEGQKRKTQFSFLDSIPEMTQEGDGIGTIWLGSKQPFLGARQSGTSSWSRFSVGGSVSKFCDVSNANSVYRLILDVREQAPENNPHPRPKLLGPCPFRPQTMWPVIPGRSFLLNISASRVSISPPNRIRSTGGT